MLFKNISRLVLLLVLTGLAGVSMGVQPAYADLACGPDTCPNNTQHPYNWYECKQDILGVCYEEEHVNYAMGICRYFQDPGDSQWYCRLDAGHTPPSVDVGGCLNYGVQPFCNTKQTWVAVGCCPGGGGGGGGGGGSCTWTPSAPTYCSTYGWDTTTSGLMVQVYGYDNDPAACFPGHVPGYFCKIMQWPTNLDERLFDGGETMNRPKEFMNNHCWGRSAAVVWGGEFDVATALQKPGRMYVSLPGLWQFRIQVKYRHQVDGDWERTGFDSMQANVYLNGVTAVSGVVPHGGAGYWCGGNDEDRCFEGSVNIPAVGWYPFEAEVMGNPWDTSEFTIWVWPPGAAGWSIIRTDRWEYNFNPCTLCAAQNPPTNVIPNNTTQCAGSTLVRWTAPAGPAPASYTLTVTDTTTGGVTTYPGLTVLQQAHTLVCNHGYTFAVTATNACGNISPAATATLTPAQVLCAPARPDGVTVVDDINKLYVSWMDQSTNETRFEVSHQSNFATILATINSVTTAGTGLRYGRPPTPATREGYSDAAVACPGSYSYYVRAVAPGNPVSCRNSTGSVVGIGSCADYSHAWFQTKGCGAISAAGPLDVWLPAGSFFQLPGRSPGGGPAGMPGVVYANGVGPHLTTANVSSLGQLVNIAASGGWGALAQNLENQYTTIHERIVPRVVERDISSCTNWGCVSSSIAAATAENMIPNPADPDNPDIHVIILEKASGDLTIDSAVDLGATQVLILMGGGNLTINSPITYTDGSGFFAAIVNGSINISADIGRIIPAVFPYQYTDMETAAADLKGIYYAQDSITTGTTGGTDKQFKLVGSIVAAGDVQLQRHSLGENPAEFIECDPRSTSILRIVGLRRVVEQQPIW